MSVRGKAIFLGLGGGLAYLGLTGKLSGIIRRVQQQVSGQQRSGTQASARPSEASQPQPQIQSVARQAAGNAQPQRGTADRGPTAPEARRESFPESATAGGGEHIPPAVLADTSAADDMALREKVESALHQDPHFENGGAIVSVDQGVVTLRGTVQQVQTIQDAQSIVRGVPGVKGLQNLLHVQGTPEPARATDGEVGAGYSRGNI